MSLFRKSLLSSSFLLFTVACGEGLPPEEAAVEPVVADELGATESPLLFGILAGSRVRR